jgi:hypothetical protein
MPGAATVGGELASGKNIDGSGLINPFLLIPDKQTAFLNKIS